MKIRMLIDVSGTRNGKDWPPRGSVLEVDDAEGQEYVRNGMAVPVTTHREVERAVTVDDDVELRTEAPTVEEAPRPRRPEPHRRTPQDVRNQVRR